jgi:hypothetical protein
VAVKDFGMVEELGIRMEYWTAVLRVVLLENESVVLKAYWKVAM